MPYNGVGQFTSLGAPIFPAVSNTFILASYFNSTMNDVFQGLSGAITRDGQSPATADLPMGGFTLTNVLAAASAGQPITYAQSNAVVNSLTVTSLLNLPGAVAFTGTATAVGAALDLTGGTVNVATQTTGNSTTKAASTAFVADAITSLPGGSLPSLVGSAGQVLVVNPDEATVSWEKRFQDDVTGESTTSMAISIATGKAFTTASGKGWTAGMPIIAYYNATNYMTCTVASYTGTTLTLDCTAITGSGTFASWSIYPDMGSALYRKSIFSTETLTMYGASVLESITPPTYDTGVGSYAVYPIYANSLFIVTSLSSQATVRTSPDGITWTYRALPSSQVWNIASNGTDKFIANVNASTATAKSTDGITWVSGTALPAVSANISVCFVGNTALVCGSGAGNYVSSDNAATWSALQNLPTTPGSKMFSVGGLFLFWGSSTNYYTSPTGLTGSWTTRTLPVTPSIGGGSFFKDTDGAIVYVNSGTQDQQYRTTDGISWTALSHITSYSAWRLNGVSVEMTTTVNASKTWHNGLAVLRNSTVNVNSGYGFATSPGGVLIASSGAADGKVARFDSTYAPTALFSR